MTQQNEDLPVSEATYSRVLDQLADVREDGRTNMIDRNGVQRAAYDLKHFALVSFIEDATSGQYMAALEDMAARR